MFWDNWHYGQDDYHNDDYHNDDYHHDDYDQDCEWKQVSVECSEFRFLEDEQCLIEASYSPCETDFFYCSVYKQGGVIEDCVEDF